MRVKFSTLVKRHEREVYTLAYYLLRDRGAAEDAAQETYIALWENLEQVDLLRSRAWLMAVTRNNCLDRLRRRRREQDLQADMEEPTVTGPAEVLEVEQQSAQVRTLIGSLEEPFRSLVILRDINQHSYREIAQTLELSLDQVRVYLHRARQQLRNRIMEWK